MKNELDHQRKKIFNGITDLEATKSYLRQPPEKYEILWPLEKTNFPSKDGHWFIVITSPKLKQNFLNHALHVFGIDSIFKINKYK